MAANGLPAAAWMLSSPYDLDAHDATTYTPSWVGDHVHGTESCAPEHPYLITHGDTTAGPVADAVATKASHEP